MRNIVRLTPLLYLVPHLLHLPFLDLGGGRIETPYLVVLLVGQDGVWQGRVFGFGHFILGDGGERR